ncbi:hypothetical protein J4434_07180 [Candidatus Woesearchaeota archaeon]|nr:hypothetical protein [uncultured archaeon]MBS3122637.1 hypothetical protein [Candidatus Woesearchaeota archaeon]
MINLEMQVNKTQAGLYTIAYVRKEAPLDVQEAAFAVHGLHTVSPAQLGFLRAQEPKGTFNPYSRTNADVFYDDRTNQVVIVPNEAISKQISITNLVNAHRQCKEYIIPQDQRDLVYAMVDEMLRKGTAFTASHGEIDIPISEFGQVELTSSLFSDGNLGIKAQDYGDWQKEQGRASQSMYFDGANYAKSQKGPYLNRLRVCGPDVGFGVVGNGRLLDCDSGAFGVRFEKTAEGGAKK